MGAVFLGGMARLLLTRKQDPETAELRRERGVLFGSGLVGGGGLTGVLLALWVGLRGGQRIVGWPPEVSAIATQIVALAAILAIVGFLMASARRTE